MSDSRYGIIEKLTRQKVQLISEKNSLNTREEQIDEEILGLQQSNADEIAEYNTYITNSNSKYASRIKQKELEKGRVSKDKKDQIESIGEQIAAIDNGLKQLKEISEAHSKRPSYERSTKSFDNLKDFENYADTEDFGTD